VTVGVTVPVKVGGCVTVGVTVAAGVGGVGTEGSGAEGSLGAGGGLVSQAGNGSQGAGMPRRSASSLNPRRLRLSRHPL